MRLKNLAFFVVTFLFWGVSCSKAPPFEPITLPPTNATDAPLNRVGTSANSIDALNKRAHPEANNRGQIILEAQSEEIEALRAHLKAAIESNALATAGWLKREVEYRAALAASQEQTKDWKAKYERVIAEWGYRMQLWVEWAWFWIKCYFALCLLLFVLRFVPGAVGGFAALAFSVLWIPGWFNAFADNAYFRGWVPWMRKGDKS
jgi:hypothetical protein